MTETERVGGILFCVGVLAGMLLIFLLEWIERKLHERKLYQLYRRLKR